MNTTTIDVKDIPTLRVIEISFNNSVFGRKIH